jgi:hypothetical protein
VCDKNHQVDSHETTSKIQHQSMGMRHVSSQIVTPVALIELYCMYA